jgi:colicin import membrane protein
MKLLCPLCCCLVAALAMSHAFASDAADEKAERARIKSERAKVEAAYAQRERDCRTRFVVTSCIEEARRDRRQSLEGLRLQQEVLDEQQRKQRAAQRMDEIRAKVGGEEAKRQETDAATRRTEKQRADVAGRPASGSASSAVPAQRSAAQPLTTRQTPGEEARHAAEYEQRQQEAQTHRDEVARRNAERAAKGKAPAKPLPLPASAASDGG